MGLAVRQVDADLDAARSNLPRALPATHAAVLAGWTCDLKTVNGVTCRFTPGEFVSLSPLARAFEVGRCHAEALLALARAGERPLSASQKEEQTQRALGILPTDEGSRFLEISACPEFRPHFLTSNPERFISAMLELEKHVGLATTLGYGFLLMAGIRSDEDMYKYGDRIEGIFESVTAVPAIQDELNRLGDDGIEGLPSAARVRLLRSVHEQLWNQSPTRPGRFFLLTQVVDGYLGLRKGGVGDDLGLAVLDAIVAAKLLFPVRFLNRGSRVYLAVVASPRVHEYWDPLRKEGEVQHRQMTQLGLIDVFVQGYVRMAYGYANAGSWAHGIRTARWVLGMKPECAAAYQILGQCHLGEQDPRRAIKMCDAALEIDLRLADAYLVRGNAHSAMSSWSDAIKDYRLAIRHRIGFAEAYNNLGLALQRNGELERAAGAYREAVRIRPDYAEALYNLGNLFLERAQTTGSAEDLDQAVDAYREAVAQSPNFAAAFYNLGQAYYCRKDLPEALAAYQSAIKANPKHAGAWHNLGIVYRDLGQQELAVEAIEKAVQLNPMLLR
jgi:tetratricopeptide (TPR) repeat protein